MTLAFSHKLLPNSSDGIFGCVQMSKEPKDSVDASWAKKHCRKCNSLLFPLKSDETKFDCPICNHDIEFSEKTYRVQKFSEERKITFFVFDITIPYDTLVFLLNDLYNNVSEKEMISVVCVSDRIMFISVSHGLMQLDTFSSSASLKNPLKNFITKEDLKKVVIPSISSVYALFPDSLENIFDYYDLIKSCMKVSLRKPFSLILYSNRHAAPVDADDAQYLSQLVSSSGSVIHIGAINEFKRQTAAARCSFGVVFSVTTVPECGFMKKLDRNPITKFRIFAPPQFEFTKVTNSTGNMRMSSRLSKLKLTDFRGGSVRMSFDGGRSTSKHVNILEEVKTANGTFLTVHTFEKSEDEKAFNASINAPVFNTLMLKAFASDLLRAIWNGEKFDRVVPKHIAAAKGLIPTNSSLATIGSNEQLDILRLYYVLSNYGCSDIETRVVTISEEEEGKEGIYALIAPPVMFVLDTENTNKYEELWNSFDWPFNIKMVQTKAAFQLLANKFDAKLPESFTK